MDSSNPAKLAVVGWRSFSSWIILEISLTASQTFGLECIRFNSFPILLLNCRKAGPRESRKLTISDFEILVHSKLGRNNHIDHFLPSVDFKSSKTTRRDNIHAQNEILENLEQERSNATSSPLPSPRAQRQFPVIFGDSISSNWFPNLFSK